MQDTSSFFTRYSTKRALLLVLLFLVSFLFRTYISVTDEYLEFDVRQYHSAVIAKGHYHAYLEDPTEIEQVAILNRDRQPTREPHIMEHLTAFVYRLLGNDALWVSGIISSIFWMVGGFFLYRIATENFSSDAAIISTAIYLFMPLGIIDGNNFQPDPLMVMGIIVSVFAILRYIQASSLQTLLVAAIIAAVTLFIKPQSAFFVGMVFLAMQVYKRSWLGSVLNWHSILFAVITLSPAVLYIFATSDGQAPIGEIIVPDLLLTPGFWRGWLRIINNFVGFGVLIVAILGVFVVTDKQNRYLLLGWWAGYILLGLSFTWNIHTHRYYHLPIVPIIALSFGELSALVINDIRQRNSSRFVVPIVSGVLLVGIVFSMLVSVALGDTDFDYTSGVDTAVEIGNEVNHSTQTYYLAPSYGLPLIYHGDISGEVWYPTTEDTSRTIRGLETEAWTVDRIHKLIISSEFVDSPEYFIITDLDDWELQPMLQEYLTTNYRLIKQTDRYIIFDLTSDDLG